MMQKETAPSWLSGLDLPEVSALGAIAFPRTDVLASSLFYPAARFHGDVIAKLAPVFHSFIYVDYSVDRASLEAALSSFRGYSLEGYAQLAPSDLASPRAPPPILGGFGGELRRAQTAPTTGEPPYASWAILKRDADRDDAHGPERFSLVYLCADGVAAYHRMYAAEGIAPRALAIIQPGHAFGGNYTNFTDPDGLFAHVVLALGAPAPEYLLCGGMRHSKSDPPWWPAVYDTQVAHFAGPHPWSVWRRSPLDPA